MVSFVVDVSRLNDKQYLRLCKAFDKHGFLWLSNNTLESRHYRNLMFFNVLRKLCTQASSFSNRDTNYKISYALAVILGESIEDFNDIVYILYILKSIEDRKRKRVWKNSI